MAAAAGAASAATRLEEHRVALTGHCYRMLGSAAEADDAVQETMVRAWKSLDRFEERAAVKTWLYRIATNVCLDALAAAKKSRVRPIDGPAGTTEDELVAYERTHWLEPIPDAKAIPSDADPSEAAVLKESIRLAFVAALQHLPPRQRAALLLTEVLGWSAAEVADALEMTVAAVNSGLQRARATLATKDVAAHTPLTAKQEELVDRYVAAFATYDVDGLVSLLRDDARFCMPPYSLWLQGRAPVRAWLLGRGSGCRGSKVVRTTGACGHPAFAHYRVNPDGGFKAFSLTVLELDESSITGWTSFLDVETLFPLFGLPLTLPE
ncbi:MAG: sigma-70 family RNA polymerase sigma factor [Labilithrix sp.]|nr:sigma-70 family RNA polymerase sigma factor [Labilithrix sp.]MCW5813236.1 sigma-70 family RNA polymerase sigma factor [Labilithrix sp.]